MNDDDLLDLFALDLPDLSGCAPDLAQAVDVCVGDSFNAAALTLARPVAGAAPAPWDWLRDRLEGLGGVGDRIFDWIRDALTALAEWVWDRIGGTIRWLYNWGVDIVDWLSRQLLGLFTWLGEFINNTATWIRNRVWDAADWVEERVWDAAHWGRDRLWDTEDFLTDRLWDAAHWVGDRIVEYATGLWTSIWDAANWIKDQAWNAANWIKDQVWDAADWTGGQILGAADWVKDCVWDAAAWTKDAILPPIMGGMSALGDAIGDAFGEVGNVVGGALGEVGDRIGDVGHFLVEGAWEPATEFLDRKLDVARRLFRGEFETWEDLWAAALNPPVAPLLIVAAFFGLLALNALNVATSAIVGESIEPMVQTQRQKIAARTLMTGDAQELLLRGEIDQGTFIDHLGRWGYSETNARHLMALAQRIPGSGDLVRFAVREAFDRSKAEALGFITPLPGDFSLWMERLGFATEWSERFWWAHWDLPSVTQGFEMLHRDVISPDDLEGLLIALDIPPKWIPRLLDISYNVITRVDIRRLYQDGIVEEDEVRETYERMGYSPDDARKITEMVKIRYARGGKGEGVDLRELTLSTVKQAYVRRLVDRDEALEKLLAMDFPEEDAELILSIWDFDLAQDPDQRSDIGLRELSASVIERAYERRLFDFNRALVELVELGYTQEDAEIKLHLVDFRMAEDLTELQIDGALNDLEAGLISPAEVESRLGEFGLPAERIDYLLQRERLRRQVKTRRLTVSQLQRARAAGLIATDDELLDRIGVLGYNERDASILVAMV